jgi:hypothetical protein
MGCIACLIANCIVDVKVCFVVSMPIFHLDASFSGKMVYDLGCVFITATNAESSFGVMNEMWQLIWVHIMMIDYQFSLYQLWSYLLLWNAPQLPAAHFLQMFLIVDPTHYLQ